MQNQVQSLITVNQGLFGGSPTPPAPDALLKEDGDNLLLENGDRILLE